MSTSPNSPKVLLSRVRQFYNPSTWNVEPDRQRHVYLDGIRGLLVLSSILWIFFYTFIPGLLANTTGTSGSPTYQKLVRDILAPLFWNESLISSFFFILSARSIGVRFLTTPNPVSFAGSIIRRIVRMSIAVGLAVGLSCTVFKGWGVKHIDDFKVILPNNGIPTPRIANNSLTALNAMFDFFWVVRSYYYQAANHFWPTMTIGNLSLLYQQSWTVYFLMLILPYSRINWHIQGLTFFALGSFWYASWGWYDAAALLLADYVVNPSLRPRLHAGIKVPFTEDSHVPMAIPAALMAAAGIAMKYIWTIFPQYINEELVLHPYIDLSETTNKTQFAGADPYARVDNFLVIFGLLLLVETSAGLRSALSSWWLVGLGKRSLSFFVAQNLVFWTTGIKLFLHLHHVGGFSTALANLIVFFVGTMVTWICAELYYRSVDLPSMWVANRTYVWLTEK